MRTPKGKTERENFSEVLLAGGKMNSLGRAEEVVLAVLADKSLMEELYLCMFHEDAWVRMRAADAFEKVCRAHPEWIEGYIDRLQNELSGNEQQASIKWHIAEIYQQVKLNDTQKRYAIDWLSRTLSSSTVDWIVSANCMKTLAEFTTKGDFPRNKLIELLKIQQTHKSKSVVKKAGMFLESFS